MPPTAKNFLFDTFPTLHTERLNLGEIKKQHLGELFKLFGNSAVTR